MEGALALLATASDALRPSFPVIQGAQEQEQALVTEDALLATGASPTRGLRANPS